MRPRYCDGKKSIKSFGVLRGSSLACLKGLKVIILQGTLKSQTLDKKLISYLLLTFFQNTGIISQSGNYGNSGQKSGISYSWSIPEESLAGRKKRREESSMSK